MASSDLSTFSAIVDSKTYQELCNLEGLKVLEKANQTIISTINKAIKGFGKRKLNSSNMCIDSYTLLPFKGTIWSLRSMGENCLKEEDGYGTFSHPILGLVALVERLKSQEAYVSAISKLKEVPQLKDNLTDAKIVDMILNSWMHALKAETVSDPKRANEDALFAAFRKCLPKIPAASNLEHFGGEFSLSEYTQDLSQQVSEGGVPSNIEQACQRFHKFFSTTADTIAEKEHERKEAKLKENSTKSKRQMWCPHCKEEVESFLKKDPSVAEDQETSPNRDEPKRKRKASK
jgi:hypothetical protein